MTDQVTDSRVGVYAGVNGQGHGDGVVALGEWSAPGEHRFREAIHRVRRVGVPAGRGTEKGASGEACEPAAAT
jgi:hypothetical protein